MSRIVYVNGEYVPEEEARVSIFDRGFVFGDGVYEVVPVIRGRLADRDYFLQRLTRSLDELGIAWPCSEAEYQEVLEQLVARNSLEEGIVYTQVTRGASDRQFTFPANTPSSMAAFTQVMPLLENPSAANGITVVTTSEIRWLRRDIKSLNLLAQVLAKQYAADQGAGEAWMIEDGLVTEGASSTAYIVMEGKVITRPLSNRVLPGIRRRRLLELAAEAGIAFEERPFSLAEALAADEAFVSSATTILHPVISVDGNRIGDGKPGPLTRKLRGLYIDHMLEEVGA
ncbi:MAG: D-amino-acid transaminase [Gammaproteobacteria bacterium]|nr:D-amino-acid transaminase [Gammaproteobacteria bacterium]MYE30642.1 D-amino-acid transaminase [Gammaproteobacteria bacterium]MYI01309.1 D-amino-acid transaminase [Gammaproteobacteria bacterium]